MSGTPLFRRAPVPGTRKRTGYGRAYLRQPRTAAERRQNALVLAAEHEPAPRARRTGPNLPSSWDDIPRERARGWKARGKKRRPWYFV